MNTNLRLLLPTRHEVMVDMDGIRANAPRAEEIARYMQEWAESIHAVTNVPKNLVSAELYRVVADILSLMNEALAFTLIRTDHQGERLLTQLAIHRLTQREYSGDADAMLRGADAMKERHESDAESDED